jgi:fimbrial chaperone protein
LSALALLPIIAAASDLQVDPTRIELSPQQQSTVITITNDSDQPASIQIQVVAWSQVDGKDVYVPTRELLVAPPIVTIAAKSEQVLRAALRRPADATSELSYRIYLQEVPPPPAPGFKGLQVALRIGLPVFMQPQQGKAAAKMIWAASRMPGGGLKVALQNQGNAHVQVSDFALYLPGSDKLIAREAGSTYVLAGQMRAWLLKTEASQNTSGGSVRLRAYTDAGDVDAELTLGPP